MPYYRFRKLTAPDLNRLTKHLDLVSRVDIEDIVNNAAQRTADNLAYYLYMVYNLPIIAHDNELFFQTIIEDK
jgi:ferritin-like protein